MSRYDFTRISATDLTTLSYELYQNGLISARDHAVLSHHAQQGGSEQPDADSQPGNVDFLSRLETRLQSQRDEAASANSIRQTEKILTILRSLQAIKG